MRKMFVLAVLMLGFAAVEVEAACRQRLLGRLRGGEGAVRLLHRSSCR